MEIENIIRLSNGDYNIKTPNNNLIHATYADPSMITPCIFNRSDVDIHLTMIEVYNEIIDPTKLICKTELDDTIKGNRGNHLERHMSYSIQLEYSAIPLIVWSFEYNGHSYRISHFWNSEDIETLEILK